MQHANPQRWDDGTLSLGQLNPSHEKLSQCSSGGQLDVLVSAMTELPRLQKERKTSGGLVRLKRRQDSQHMPDTTYFLFELILHPIISVLMPKGMKSVSSFKHLTTNRFIRMTHWDFNHPNRYIYRESGTLV